MKTKLTKLTFFLGFLALFGCSQKDTITDDVTRFQDQIDSVLTWVLVPMQDSLTAKGAVSAEAEVEVAYQLIPIKTAHFLLSAQSDTLSEALKQYQNHRLDGATLRKKLTYSQFYVDSLLTANIGE
jgi:hypothetical protein